MSERRFANVPVSTLMSLDEFEASIRAVGAERYHDKHTFHKLLHDVLWAQLDALEHAYVEGNVPPGAFRPEIK